MEINTLNSALLLKPKDILVNISTQHEENLKAYPVGFAVI